MDHVTIPAVVQTPTGPDAVMLEVGVEDSWVILSSSEVGGPSITIDKCTMQRIVAAWERLSMTGAGSGEDEG